ncbi:hypothetical protein N7494_005336 [Penicillium frequentans]|uniref:Uncharacterized protein n=1 Tax=Penicillium frequentans TaxID=3151616 RepID=A0AAD6CY09_9EURO|nr:hypothetical protein N7494_005336 [Penicillium glabrum]
MVIRRITPQGTDQGVTVDTPHNHSSPDASRIGTDDSEKRTPRISLPISSSDTGPEENCAEGDMTTRDREEVNFVRNTPTSGEDNFGGSEISGGSWVVNGNVEGKPKPNYTHTHIMNGVKVTRGSTFVNGDMNPDTFMKIFCRPR